MLIKIIVKSANQGTRAKENIMEMPVEYMVSEVDLKRGDTLLPLFETVVNAIISLKQTKDCSKKKIDIHIERGELPQQLKMDGDYKTIQSIKVIDNGEGFNEKNLTSYKTAYTRNNKKFGCKGIGRFTVLAAFEKIEVDSIFKERKSNKKVTFTFDSIKEVDKVTTVDVGDEKRRTIVTLKNLHNKLLKEESAMSVDSIATKLMNHCLVFHLCGDLPEIEILDLETKEKANLKEHYNQLKRENEKIFKIKDFSFKTYITRTLKENNRKNHYAYYCANSRVVGGGRSLTKNNNLFQFPIHNNGASYFLDVYLVSDYFDKNVFSSRNGFSIPYQSDLNVFDSDSITYEEIEQKLGEVLKKEYSSHVIETQKKNIEDIVKYIDSKAPKYKRFANKPDLLKSIPPNLSEDKKDEFLYKIAYQESKKINKRIEDFIKKKKVNKATIEKVKKEIAEKTLQDKDSLADYMLSRKAIIDIFKKFIEADKNGDYKLEEDIHNLIYPMGFTNEELNYENHNLWLLDERFNTFQYIGSDKPISSFSDKKSGKKPDITMFGNPMGFASQAGGQVQKMVVFEFKRPGETAHDKRPNDYTWEFSVLVDKYFDEFIYGDSKTNPKGRPVVVDKHTPKFGYIILDVIPKKLREYNEGKGYKTTPFGTIFKSMPELNLYIEVLTFDQLIKSVEDRHTPFFDKLFQSTQA